MIKGKLLLLILYMAPTTAKVETNEELLVQEQKLKTPENPRMGAVFENGMPPNVAALNRATDPVRAELATLQGLQSMNPTEERAEKIINLERQRGRIARFAMLQKGATPEQKEILKEKDALEKLKASDLLFLKKK